MCCSGRVHLPSEDSLLVQQIIHESHNRKVENEFSLSRNDIYKELGVMGYDYSGDFQRLTQISTNDFKTIRGICEWNGNLITFLDALMQSMALSAPFRKLMVPVMIKVVRIDPKVLFEAVRHNKVSEIKSEDQIEMSIAREELDKEIIDNVVGSCEEAMDSLSRTFCMFRANMPLHFNARSGLLVTYGIEVENVVALPIPRRLDSTNLVLDSYQFLLNDDNQAIDESNRKAMVEYIEVMLI